MCFSKGKPDGAFLICPTKSFVFGLFCEITGRSLARHSYGNSHSLNGKIRTHEKRTKTDGKIVRKTESSPQKTVISFADGDLSSA
jgi:hypothetical protein